MRKLVALGALAAMAVGAQAVAAEGFSYTLAEGQFLSGDGFDGLGVSGSYAFTPDYFAVGSIESWDIDGVSNDASLLSLGAGYHRALNQALDVVATASLKRIKFDGFGSETGFGLGVGVRGRLVEMLEVNAGLEYVDIADGSDTTLQVGGRWYFTNAFAAGLDLQDNDGGSTLRFAARYDFAPR